MLQCNYSRKDKRCDEEGDFIVCRERAGFTADEF